MVQNMNTYYNRSTHAVRCLACIAFTSIALYIASESVCRGADDIGSALTIDKIRAAWAERQRQAETVLVKWEDETVFRKSDYVQSEELKEKFKDAPEFLTATGRWELRLDGDRFDLRRQRPEAELYGFTRRTRISFDGQTSCELGEFIDNDPTAIISDRRDRSDGRRGLVHFAVLIAYRPLDEDLTMFPLGPNTQLNDKRESHRDTMCVVLENSERDATSLVERLWIDAETLSPRRFEIFNSGKLAAELNIEYATQTQKAADDVQLVSWESVLYSPDKKEPDEKVVARITYFNRDAQIPLSEFQITLPPGTWIIDEITDTRSKLPDGAWESRGVPAQSAHRRPWWIVAVVLGVIAAVWCGVLYARRV